MKLEHLLNQSYDRMNESEREITRYILEHRGACARASIGETADARCWCGMQKSWGCRDTGS